MHVRIPVTQHVAFHVGGGPGLARFETGPNVSRLWLTHEQADPLPWQAVHEVGVLAGAVHRRRQCDQVRRSWLDRGESTLSFPRFSNECPRAVSFRSWNPPPFGIALDTGKCRAHAAGFNPPGCRTGSATNRPRRFHGNRPARRDDNWQKLRQYVLDERETLEVTGPGGVRLFGFRRDYSWFIRQGISYGVQFSHSTSGASGDRPREAQGIDSELDNACQATGPLPTFETRIVNLSEGEQHPRNPDTSSRSSSRGRWRAERCRPRTTTPRRARTGTSITST